LDLAASKWKINVCGGLPAPPNPLGTQTWDFVWSHRFHAELAYIEASAQKQSQRLGQVFAGTDHHSSESSEFSCRAQSSPILDLRHHSFSRRPPLRYVKHLDK